MIDFSLKDPILKDPPFNEPSVSFPENAIDALKDTVENTNATALSEESVKRLEGEEVLTFEGTVLTAPQGPVPLSDEARKYCALFENGLWLVSKSHHLSPLVTSIESIAKQLGYGVDDPMYVAPDVIQNAYRYAEGRASGVVRLDQNSVKRRIEKMIQDAAALHASDIHIQTNREISTVQFTVDGEMDLYATLTMQEGHQVLSSLFTHSEVPSGVTEDFYQPQAGMLSATSPSQGISLPKNVSSVRCQWMPLAEGGRYLVMRLHYPDVQVEEGTRVTLETLGYEQQQIKLLKEVKDRPGGMRLMSGPTNHGKTTSNKVLLTEHVEETKGRLNLLQIEDPPEGGIKGARQIGISVTNDSGARTDSFSKIMRAVLRLAPDMLMLGEIRDTESAVFATRLSIAGSQVYTTIHVHSALAIPKRLTDLGIEPYLVYDPQLMVALMSQRLVRKLCQKCKIPLKKLTSQHPDLMTRVMRALQEAESQTGLLKGVRLNPSHPIEGIFVANEKGCSSCKQGHKGRTVAAEIILPDAHLMKLLRHHEEVEAEKYWLSPEGLDGFSMRHHGLLKLLRGEISPLDFEKALGPLFSTHSLQKHKSKTRLVAV